MRSGETPDLENLGDLPEQRPELTETFMEVLLQPNFNIYHTQDFNPCIVLTNQRAGKEHKQLTWTEKCPRIGRKELGSDITSSQPTLEQDP